MAGIMKTNKMINGVNASRYTASWIMAGGDLCTKSGRDNFLDWLTSMMPLEEAVFLFNTAVLGKRELKDSAKSFVNRTAENS